MLPVKAGDQRLSDGARQKLELFYRLFCEGENRARYGLGHIVFACHASFPLLLSPELANLIWLNFGNYASRRGKAASGGGTAASDPGATPAQQKIDPVTVTDFLLSPLVRPVANRQYEIIPELRSYFLYLLKDSRWFNLFGIQPFGEDRLNELANFTLLYLQDKKAQRENEATGFHQLNRWSALAWLDPDLLAKEMALALKDTFPARQDEAEDDRGQLRIYMLADRLNKQIGLDIHSKSGSPRLFVNFQRYTNMNMLRLLGNDVDFYEGYDRLEGEFIATDRGDGSAVTLPLKKGIGSRLYRNKNNIQRVFPVLIGFAPFFTTIVENLKRQALFGDLEYSQDDFTPVANAKEIRDTLEMISLLANDEDLVLIVYSQAMEKQFPLIELVNFLNGKRRSGYRLLLIADTSNTDFTRSTSERTIALWLPQYNYTYLTTVLDSVESRISYKDLYHLLQSIDFSIRPLFFIPEDQWNNYFLRRQSGTIPHDDAYIIYDRDRHRWKIWEEDFNPVPDGARGRIFDLTGKQVPDNMGGFVRKHESGMYLEVGDESLTQQYVYRFRPEGPGLTYYTNEDIPDLPVVPYSRWKSFEGASEDNAALQILQHHHIDLSYEVTYHDREVSEQYRWTPTTPEEFTRLLTKLNRWAFLKYMMLPNHEQGFEIKEHYYKEDKSADPDTLLLKTVDGVVAFEDLQINILPFENFDFYVDIYLLLDDLSIIRLIHSSEPISPSTTTSFRIPGETIPMKILERELRFTLKFLYSRDPIITDFSQDGY